MDPSGNPDRDAAKGQASVLGVILVLGMVLAGTAVVVTIGGDALGDVQGESELERGRNAMTLLNTRASMVALGNSPGQRITLGRDGGQLEGKPDSGWLRITHGNFTTNGDDEVVYNESLGAVVYTNDGTRIAYQGGGVWQKGSTGEARMVSPPEFHYRASTLTLPIVRVSGEGGRLGGSAVRIGRAGETRRVFPNSTDPTPGSEEVGPPYNITDDAYTNPVANGTVNITVKSDYARGWAEYFRTRTDGRVTVGPDRDRVTVSLESLAGAVGDFAMPQEGQSLSVRGLGTDHPIDQYELTLAASNDGTNFNNMHWAFFANEGNEEFELHFYSDGKCAGGSYNGDIDVSIYYYGSGGSVHEEWQNTSVQVPTNDDFEVDCTTMELSVDLMSETPLAYDDIQLTGSDNKWHFGPEIDSRDVPGETESFVEHGVDTGNYTTGQTETLEFLVNHYFELLGPQFELEVTDGPGGGSRIDESASAGSLAYETGANARYITFLHITENRINVTSG